MTVQIQPIKDYVLPQVNIVPPTGWYPDEVLQSSYDTDTTDKKTFERKVNSTLPVAARKSEELIDNLTHRLDISVSTSYLTIDADATYHVLLLVTEHDYHSPNIRAAKLVADRFTTDSDDMSIRFTFTIGRERLISNFTPNSYRLKYIHHIEASPAILS